MTEKNNWVIFFIIGILIFIIFFNNNIPNTIQGENVKTEITATCYDINKVQIDCNPKIATPTFSLNDFFGDIKFKIDNFFISSKTNQNTNNSTSKAFIIRNLLNAIGKFSIITTTRSFNIPISSDYSYCRLYYSGGADSYSYLEALSRDIGSNDRDFTDYRVCNGMMLFREYSIPSDLISSSQITSIKLNYMLSLVEDESATGVSTDFAVINNLNNYDYTPDDSSSRQLIYERMEAVSDSPDFTISPSDNQPGGWRSGEVSPWYGKDFIVKKEHFPIGIEGDYSGTYDKFINFYNTGSTYPPYLTVTYTTQNCVPETCSSLGKTCGTIDDTCGNTLTCGSACPCVPETCSSLGLTCGTTSDGCGNTLTCGSTCSFGLCYQESANVATACGGLSTGGYIDSMTFGTGAVSGIFVYDGDWNTAKSRDSSGSSSIISSYYKPINSQPSSLWQIKYGLASSPTMKNISIPTDCWNYFSDKINLKLESLNDGAGHSNAYCYNGIWKLIDTSTADNSLFEEGMEWFISQPIASLKYQINIINKGGTDYENVKLISTNPSSFFSYFPNKSFNLSNWQIDKNTCNWTSDFIDITAYNGQNFFVSISGLNTYTNKTEIYLASRSIP